MLYYFPGMLSFFLKTLYKIAETQAQQGLGNAEKNKRTKNN
jgi:hypothetical protein